MNQDVRSKLHTLAGEVREREPLSQHSSFRIGGEAEVLFLPENSEAVAQCVALCHEHNLPLWVIGNGSNLLISDKGLPGVVLRIGTAMSEVGVEGTRLTAQAGASMAKIAAAALQSGLSGLEFASGIPGTLGGGVVMNAGAYGGELKDVLESVTWLSEDGEIHTDQAENLSLGYRTSRFAKEGGIVLSATFRLKEGNPEDIKGMMQDFNNRRREKQPLEYPSAGSTFKRPTGYFAGALIEEANLKGYTIGGAQVSEKHAGFVINRGDATAKDIMELIRYVQDKVEETSGVRLEPEVKIWGDFE